VAARLNDEPVAAFLHRPFVMSAKVACCCSADLVESKTYGFRGLPRKRASNAPARASSCTRFRSSILSLPKYGAVSTTNSQVRLAGYWNQRRPVSHSRFRVAENTNSHTILSRLRGHASRPLAFWNNLAGDLSLNPKAGCHLAITGFSVNCELRLVHNL
jgi:hypothetical protein